MKKDKKPAEEKIKDKGSKAKDHKDKSKSSSKSKKDLVDDDSDKKIIKQDFPKIDNLYTH